MILEGVNRHQTNPFVQQNSKMYTISEVVG